MLGSIAHPQRAPELLAVRESISGWRSYDSFRTDITSPVRIPQIGIFTPVLNKCNRFASCPWHNSAGLPNENRIYFATAYNRFGEGKPWRQERVRQFFADEELLIGRDFWNFVCRSESGYEIVIDEYRANAHLIRNCLDSIKSLYLKEPPSQAA